MPRDERLIAALKRERAGYLARGLEDRAAQVDEQLQIHGHETPEVEVPEGRTSVESVQQTADTTAPAETAAVETTPPAGSATAPKKPAGRARPKPPRDTVTPE